MNIKREKWEDVADWEGFYQVSNLGRVRSLSRTVTGRAGSTRRVNGKILKLSNILGYPSGFMSKPGFKVQGFKAHRLVAKAFIPNPENKPCVNHKNGIRHDNRVKNLEWCTYSENNIHAILTGLKAPVKGFDNGRCKLNESELKNICDLIDKGQLNQTEIASKFNITRMAVSQIHLGTNWNHLTNRKGNVPLLKEYKIRVVNCRGEVFESMADAATKYETHISSISRVCEGERLSSGKYPDGGKIKWKYDELS